jgi:ABC-type transport system substrate-binding protein
VELEVRDVMLRYAPTLAEDLTAIGVQTEVKSRPDPEFFERVRGGRASLYILRFSCRTGDSQELLDKWVHSRDPERGYGEFNYSYEHDPIPGLDAEIEQARRQLEPGVRMAALRKLMARVTEARLAIPLLQESSLVFASPRSNGRQGPTPSSWPPRCAWLRLRSA